MSLDEKVEVALWSVERETDRIKFPWYRPFARKKLVKKLRSLAEDYGKNAQQAKSIFTDLYFVFHYHPTHHIAESAVSLLDCLVANKESNKEKRDIAERVVNKLAFFKNEHLVKDIIDLFSSYRNNLEMMQFLADFGGILSCEKESAMQETEKVYNSEEFRTLVSYFQPYQAKIIVGGGEPANFEKCLPGARKLIDFLKGFEGREAKQVAIGISDVINRRSNETSGPNLDSFVPILNLIDLLKPYKTDVGSEIAWRVGEITLRMGDISDTGINDLIDLLEFYKNRPETALRVVKSLGNADKRIKEFMTVYYLDADRFSPHVYEELLKEDQLYGFASKRFDFFSTVKKERDFLNQQTSETVLPLAVILYEVGSEYVDKIKQLAPYALRNLSESWAIAKNNIPLGQFYELFKGALDKGYADKWAKAIVEGYRTSRDEGLKMVLKDVA